MDLRDMRCGAVFRWRRDVVDAGDSRSLLAMTTPLFSASPGVSVALLIETHIDHKCYMGIAPAAPTGVGRARVRDPSRGRVEVGWGHPEDSGVFSLTMTSTVA